MGLKFIFDTIYFALNLIYFIVYGIIVCLVHCLCGKNVSEEWRKTYFANFFTSNWFVTLCQQLFQQHRALWLTDFTKLKSVNPKEKLNVLEIGVGGGANFELYPDNCRLTALDYNDCFKKPFMKNINKYPDIELDGYITGQMEDMRQLADNSYDAVLITHVLCSVTDVGKGLAEVRRVLKKGGKLFFFEHVAYQDNSICSYVQRVLNPFWTIVMYNCHLTRRPWIELEKAGFTTTKINHSYPENISGWKSFMRPHIWGWAMK